jgi:hypothetical protein
LPFCSGIFFYPKLHTPDVLAIGEKELGGGPLRHHLAFIDVTQYADLIFYILIALAGLIFILHHRTRYFLQPDAKMIVPVLSCCVLYVAAHQYVYNLFFVR